MNLLVLDKSFKTIGVVDTFESIIWTDRYDNFGDFEITGIATSKIIQILQPENYVVYDGSNHVMIIEKIKLNTDAEDGMRFIISGRSVESILDRRIIWNQTILSGSVQNGIKKLLNENAISPTDINRTLEILSFLESQDPKITSLRMRAQFTGDNLLEAIIEVCQTCGIGFRMQFNSQLNGFVFDLYIGVDRSYDQFENGRVVFSPSFDNLVASTYILNSEPLKTIALVAGEGEGASRIRSVVDYGVISGLSRRELYVDARDISSDTGEDPLPMEEYLAQLDERGYEKLSEAISIENFDGSIDTTLSFKLGKDFNLGDIVQVENELSMKMKCRVSEITFSEDINGFNIYPTFRSIEDE